MKWQEERRGASGTRYKLFFIGMQFYRLQVMTGWPLVWHTLWNRTLGFELTGKVEDGAPTGPKPRSKPILDAFDDLGLKGRMGLFIRGRHIRMVQHG